MLWEDPLTEERERGADAVRRYLESLWGAFPDMELDVGRGAALLARRGPDRLPLAHDRHDAGIARAPGLCAHGRRLDAEGIDVFELRDGLVASYEGFFDARAMAQQLGLLPATGSAAERVAVAAQRITARVARRVA